jgi:pyruvate dehydrogenase E2 component (dihydrolipoamide acetyltransferase)
MAERVLMIALSPTMENGSISKWVKNEGDEISNGDVICEVETDKATMEYESVQEGTLRKILVQEGETAEIEEPIAVIGKPDEDIDPLLEEIQKEKESKAEAPETGGQKETEKEVSRTATAPEGSAPAEGRTGGPSEGGREKRVGGAGKRGRAQPVGGAEKSGDEGRGPGGKVKASPLARSIAEKYGIDIGTIRGSGPEGRVVKRDIENHLQTAGAGAAGGAGAEAAGGRAAAGEAGAGAEGTVATAKAAAGRGGAAGMAGATASTVSGIAAEAAGIPARIPAPGEDVRTPISRKRRIIAERLSQSKYTAPHYYLRITAEADHLIASRASYNARSDNRLSFNAFLVKIAAEALKRHPQVNSSWEENDIVTFGSIDIGIAVAQRDGLITPVVRNCGNKGIVVIDRELKTLIGKARNNELTPDEYTGAGFTISNLGAAGIEEFTAIINPPGSAILAVGATVKKPVITDTEEIAVRSTMALTLSCDHRVIDGAVGADFLADLKNMIEDPVRALF